MWLQIISILLVLSYHNSSGCIPEYSTALVLIWFFFFFLLGERMISGALLECPCLHIDHLSSLRALSLTFEKANNMKPVFIFSLVRSWAFPHLFTSTKGYIISFIFLNLYQNDKVEKIHNCFETDANQNCCYLEHISRSRFLWRRNIECKHKNVVGQD